MARKILLADDSVTAQNMGRKILTDAGYEVVTVNNGSAALKKIAEHKPDLIVLDVYMPGYSGLEVCQRLKENRETSRLPILLTVGKLEPFKPEEARRVKADAYIVKPFEASELLTALTRLEDKVVPQASDSPKPGRFAKAIATFEQLSSDPGEKFGDSESGWKNRLRFPSGKKSDAEPEPDAPAASQSLRDVAATETTESVPAKPDFERPMPAGLPADITPEEIAAITAAAARLSGKADPEKQESQAPAPSEPNVQTASESVPPAQSEVAPTGSNSDGQEEPAPATLASVSEPEKEPASVAVEPVEAVSAEAQPSTAPEATPAAESEDHPIEATETEALASSQPTPSTQESKTNDAEPVEAKATEECAQPQTADAEVLAALQSLTPSNDEAKVEPSATDAVASPAAIAAAAAADMAQSGLPRWIAESVAVEAAESSASLEVEMHKAFAAFAAADAGRTSAKTVISGSYVVPPTAEVSSVALAEPLAPVASIEASERTQVLATSQPAASQPAAAGDGSPSSETSADQPIAVHQDSPASEGSDRGQDAIRAAAWANWHQIRESIVGADSSSGNHSPQSAVSQSAAQSDGKPSNGIQPQADDPPAETPTEKEPEVRAAAASAGAPAPSEPAAIASIVESVLAELRPRIVEEITRKLGNEKKK